MTDFVRTVHLHGALGDRFGAAHRLAVASPAEAVRALSVLHPGFREVIAEGTWRLIRGTRPERGLAFGEDELHFRLGRGDLHIVPVATGAGGSVGRALGKVVTGLALAAGGIFLAPAAGFGAALGRAALGIGVSMALQGASSLLTTRPAVSNDNAAVDQRASFIFNGAENVTVQGGCVPIVVGRFRVGSVVVSAGLTAEQA